MRKPIATPIVSLSTVIRAATTQVSSELTDETVILNLSDGVYYGLNGVGSRVWALIQQPKQVAAVLATLVDEYAVEVGQCERDLLALLEDFATHGLIEVDYVDS